MKIRIVILLLVLFTAQAYSQSEAYYSMFWNNYSYQNPAATGLVNKHFASVSGRWFEKIGNSESYTIGGIYDFKWDKINSGIGVNYSYVKIGYLETHMVNLNYAYHYKLKNDRSLSAGVSFGIIKTILDFSHFTPIDPGDPVLTDYFKKTYTSYKFNVGAIYNTPHLLLGFRVMGLRKEAGFTPYNKPDYTLLGTYRFNILKHLEFKPGLYLNSYSNMINYCVNLTTTYKKRYWIGVTYLEDDLYTFSGGIDIRGKYRVAYAQSYATDNKFLRTSNCSHEINLALMLD